MLSVEPFSYQPSQENQGFGDRGNLRRSQMKHRDGDTSATFSRLLTCKDARGAWQDILSLHLPVKRRKFAASIASLFSSFLCRVVIQASSNGSADNTGARYRRRCGLHSVFQQVVLIPRRIFCRIIQHFGKQLACRSNFAGFDISAPSHGRLASRRHFGDIGGLEKRKGKAVSSFPFKISLFWICPRRDSNTWPQD